MIKSNWQTFIYYDEKILKIVDNLFTVTQTDKWWSNTWQRLRWSIKSFIRKFLFEYLNSSQQWILSNPIWKENFERQSPGNAFASTNKQSPTFGFRKILRCSWTCWKILQTSLSPKISDFQKTPQESDRLNYSLRQECLLSVQRKVVQKAGKFPSLLRKVQKYLTTVNVFFLIRKNDFLFNLNVVTKALMKITIKWNVNVSFKISIESQSLWKSCPTLTTSLDFMGKFSLLMKILNR